MNTLTRRFDTDCIIVSSGCPSSHGHGSYCFGWKLAEPTSVAGVGPRCRGLDLGFPAMRVVQLHCDYGSRLGLEGHCLDDFMLDAKVCQRKGSENLSAARAAAGSSKFEHLRSLFT
jgi:hypothetical protein